MSTTAEPRDDTTGLAPAPRDHAPARAEWHGGGVRAAVREFAVIVASVLCALAAQAWWQGREDRGREHDYLRQLLADTRSNGRRLEEAIRVDSTAALSTARAIDALTSPTSATPADSLVRWVVAAGAGSDYQPLEGNYRALIGTGDLRLVRNDSLRSQLAAYAAALESEGRRQEQLRQAVTAQAAPLARAMPFMRRVFLGHVSAAGVDVARLRADPDAAVVLFSLQAANANKLSGLRRLRGWTGAVLRALEAEPGVAP
jgi:hypothetical protein